MTNDKGEPIRIRSERPERLVLDAGTERLPPEARRGTVVNLDHPHLIVIDGAQAGMELPLAESKEIKIGTSRDNDLVLSDSSISRHHAIVVPQASGPPLLRDLDSTNGTFVGGCRVKETFLSPQNLVQLGRTTLKLEVKSKRFFVLPSTEIFFGPLLGQSLAMRQVFGILIRIAPTDATVLVNGPTGTGKELVARALHENSPRKDKPIVVLDCSALDRDLVSSELFGHEPGAFTGASSKRVGAFEAAHGGTIFIDEIGELPLDLQPKLLRALEQRQIKRLGGNETIDFDARVVAATHRDLKKMVEEGKFREDLFYRLSQVTVQLPPLAQRKEDIPLLASCFLESMGDRTPARKLSPEVQAILETQPFKGNVRELRNIIERAAYMASDETLQLKDLLLLEATGSGIPGLAEAHENTSRAILDDTPRSLAEVERDAIVVALRANKFNKTRTAKVLGIALNTLKKKIQDYEISE